MRRRSIVFLVVLFVSAGLLFAGFCLSGAALADLNWKDSGGPGDILAQVGYDSAHDVLYSCTATGKVWKYHDSVWTDMGGTIPYNVNDKPIFHVVYDSSRNVLYAASGNGPGLTNFYTVVWRCTSLDTSPTWNSIRVDGGYTSSINCLAFDSSRNILYIGYGYDMHLLSRGVYRCTNPDTSPSWDPTGGPIITGPGAQSIVSSLAYDASHNFLYASTSSNWYGSCVWRCTNPDTSSSWTDIGGVAGALAYDSFRNVLYSGAMRCNNPETSPTWTDSEFASGVSCFAYDSVHNVLYAGTAQGVLQCTNPDTAPSSWTDTGGVSSFSITFLVYDSTNNVLYAGTSGNGVWKYSSSAPFPVPSITKLSPTSGTVGSCIYLYGTAFGTSRGSSYVEFGSTRVSTYYSWSSTKIRVKVPSGISGALSVVVHTPTGTSNSKTFRVTPTISSISPTSGKVGSRLTVNGSAFGSKQYSTSYVKFGSKTVSSYTSWSDTKIVLKVPSRIWGTVTVKVTTSGGTSGAKTFTVKK